MTMSRPENGELNMGDCLNEESPYEALLSIAAVAESLAISKANELSMSVSSSTTKPRRQSKTTVTMKDQESQYPIVLPSSLQFIPSSKARRSNNFIDTNMEKYTTNASIESSLSCSESILSSLSKIAHGGSKASTEMRELEDQRYIYDQEVTDISNALKLRDHAQMASSALSAQRYNEAATHIQKYGLVPVNQRTKDMAGKSTARQYARTKEIVQRAIMEKYEHAVKTSDLTGLSNLTPLLALIDLAKDGVALYLRYSRDALYKAMDASENKEPDGKRNRKQEQQPQPQENSIRLQLAKIFNCAVTHLRHHLPMVASALGDADGDAALVQLIHLEVEKRAIALLKEFSQMHQLANLEGKAVRVTTRIEEKYINGMGVDLDANDSESGGMQNNGYYEESDCGFQASLGTLADLDQIMDETALALQHTESYERFIRHAVDQVMKARELRLIKKQNERKRKQELEKEDHESKLEEVVDDYSSSPTIEILSAQTQLNENVAEIGGYYSGLERVLLLATMQKAFQRTDNKNNRSLHYSPMSTLTSSNATDQLTSMSSTAFSQFRNALQTSIVEECLYASQRSTMRAFATGHAGTACAAANFCSDSLGRVFLEVLIRRAEESTKTLKPGEGLLQGNAGLGKAALSVLNSGQKRFRNAGNIDDKKYLEMDSAEMQQRVATGISHACAHYNDLEVGAEYIKRLESQFLTNIDSTFAPGHMTEQLKVCIKSLAQVHESFKNASKRCIEQLVIQLLPRVRSITSDAVGQEGNATSSFMKNSVIGGGTSTVSSVKMNYDLDDDAYQMAQISEVYIKKLCAHLDELLNPLRTYLAPDLSDVVVLGVIGGASKRIESAIRASRFTALGALCLDEDIRYFVNYAKERLDSQDFASSVALYAACNPIARLSQIALLMNVDDLDDVLDLISSSKRKGNWDLKLDDAKSLLNLRDDFEGRKVNDLLRIPDDDE